MLAIDVPVAVLSGLALAEGGKNMLKSDDPNRHYFMRVTVLLFAVFFITPIPFYFFLGWPAWEVNFLWHWQDNLHDSPLRAAVSFAVFLLTAGPAYLGFVIGRCWLRQGRDRWVRIGYVSMAALIGLTVLATRKITFNIASTMDKYEAGQFYSFWSHPFFMGWLIVSVYFWGSLFLCYMWLRARDRRFVDASDSSRPKN